MEEPFSCIAVVRTPAIQRCKYKFSTSCRKLAGCKKLVLQLYCACADRLRCGTYDFEKLATEIQLVYKSMKRAGLGLDIKLFKQAMSQDRHSTGCHLFKIHASM